MSKLSSRGINLSRLCTHTKTYFNVCTAPDNVDKKEWYKVIVLQPFRN